MPEKLSVKTDMQ